MTSDKAMRTRRQYSKELQSQVLAECAAEGASVARVAMSHGINANVIHRWRQLARSQPQETVQISRDFLPVTIDAMPPSVCADRIEVELRRGPVSMKVSWPVGLLAQFGTWTREVLR